MNPLAFSISAAKQELAALRGHLASNGEIGETELVGFLKGHTNLCGLIGTLHPDVAFPNVYAWEFGIQGRFRADLVVGDSETGAFCFVEFEDAKEESVFQTTSRTTREWSKRFEHGFSQVVDWFHWLSTLPANYPDLDDFGGKLPKIQGVLVAGRNLSKDSERLRLKWRSEWVTVGGKTVLCFTADDLVDFLDKRLQGYDKLYGK